MTGLCVVGLGVVGLAVGLAVGLVVTGLVVGLGVAGHLLQLFLQLSNMYAGFFLHSPLRAQLAHRELLSLHAGRGSQMVNSMTREILCWYQTMQTACNFLNVKTHVTMPSSCIFD